MSADVSIGVYGKASLYFESVHKASGGRKWAVLQLKDGDAKVARLTLFNIDDRLLQILYTLNKPEDDELSCPENGVTSESADA